MARFAGKFTPSSENFAISRLNTLAQRAVTATAAKVSLVVGIAQAAAAPQRLPLTQLAPPAAPSRPPRSTGASASHRTLQTQAKIAMTDLRYDEAHQLLQAALQQPAETPTDLAQTYLYLGIVERVLENRAASERAFALALLSDELSALPLAAARKLHVAFATAKAQAAAKGPWRIQLRATQRSQLATLANDPLQLAVTIAQWRNGVKIEESTTGRIETLFLPADQIVVHDAQHAVLYQWRISAQTIASATVGTLVTHERGALVSETANAPSGDRSETTMSASPSPPLPVIRSSEAVAATAFHASDLPRVGREAKPARLLRWQTWAVPAVTATAAGIGLGLAARHFESSRDNMLSSAAYYPEVVLADDRAHACALAANFAFAASAVTATVATILYFQRRGDRQVARTWHVGARNSQLGITMHW